MIKSKLRRTRKIRSRRLRRSRKFKSRRLRRTRKIRTRKLRITRKKISKNMKLKKYGGVSCRGHSVDEFLERFVDAQKNGYNGSSRDTAVNEINSGKKESDWIWYIFPSMYVEGISYNLNGERFSIRNLETAIAYLKHPILGKNLIEDLNKLKIKFGTNDITKFFKNNPKDDIPKFISCILLFYVAKNQDVSNLIMIYLILC